MFWHRTVKPHFQSHDSPQVFDHAFDMMRVAAELPEPVEKVDVPTTMSSPCPLLCEKDKVAMPMPFPDSPPSEKRRRTTMATSLPPEGGQGKRLNEKRKVG